MNNKLDFKLLSIGLQHFISMMGACILVPLLTGFPVSIALFASGIGTLIFHFTTDHKVPIYLGSSFAFIAPLAYLVNMHGNVSYALGGIIVAGAVYLLFGRVVQYFGSAVIKRLFPVRVTAPIIMLIGLSLAPVAIDQITGNIGIGIATLLVAATVAIKGNKFLTTVPVISGLIVGYILSIMVGMVDFSTVAQANMWGLPEFALPAFNLNAIVLIAPIAIVSIIEHIGDIFAVNSMLKDDIVKSPGLHKTIAGDGLATIFSGLVGGVPNTTYSENIGVLALTREYRPIIMKVAAVMAILFSFSPKFTALLQTIPAPVLGGISIILFGMIAGVGIKSLKTINNISQATFIIISIVLVIGLGGLTITIAGLEFSSIAVASIVGVILNIIFYEKD